MTWGVDTRADRQEWAAWFDAHGIKRSKSFTGINGWVMGCENPDGRIVRLYADNEEHEWGLIIRIGMKFGLVLCMRIQIAYGGDTLRMIQVPARVRARICIELCRAETTCYPRYVNHTDLNHVSAMYAYQRTKTPHCHVPLVAIGVNRSVASAVDSALKNLNRPNYPLVACLDMNESPSEYQFSP